MRERKAMSGCLVVAHLEDDTLPLQLCSTRNEALDFIAQADEETIVVALQTLDHRLGQRYLGVVSLAIIDFLDGELADRDVVRDWQAESAKAQLDRIWIEMGLRSDKYK
jgi:hypothetical protein